MESQKYHPKLGETFETEAGKFRFIFSDKGNFTLVCFGEKPYDHNVHYQSSQRRCASFIVPAGLKEWVVDYDVYLDPSFEPIIDVTVSRSPISEDEADYLKEIIANAKTIERLIKELEWL